MSVLQLILFFVCLFFQLQVLAGAELSQWFCECPVLQ